MKAFKNISLVVLLLFPVTIFAQSIIADRPDQTESSSTIPQGSFQLETGLQLGFEEETGMTIRTISAPTTLLRYGLTQKLEIRLTNQYESIREEMRLWSSGGINDLEVGAKIQLLQQEDRNTEIAFLTHLVLPTGSSGHSEGMAGTVNKISFSHGLSENVGLGYNLGYNYYGSGAGDFNYSLVLGIAINDKAGIYIEPYGELVDMNKLKANFDTGLTYLLKENFQLDFSFGTGMNYNMNYIATGFSWNIR